jgi:outer membrane protein TolC
MKVPSVCLFALSFVLAAGAQNIPPAETEVGLLAGAEALLPAQHEQLRSSAIPLTLPELESAALTHNPEILAAMRRIAVAEARRGSAGSLDDPSFMYRGWGTPLSRPWDLNQTQHMFMVSQSFPGEGKRQLRTQVADANVAVAKAEVEAKKRDVLARVREAF